MRSGHELMPWLLVLVTVGIVGSGCVSTPYEFGDDLDGELTLELRPGEEQIERGQPNVFLDGIGHYLISLPSKIILLSWRVNNHDISRDTEAAISAYLAANDMHSVKVRLNQYAPGDEWRRLAANRDMAAFYRWSLGLISTAIYTILPGRFFAGLLGGDNYNPFTNTVNLYSDSIPIALHEAGHAKDFALKSNRHWRGAYSAIRLLPLVPLWQEAVASNEAMSYLYEIDDTSERKAAYRSLYPAYGTYVGGVGGQTLQFVSVGPVWAVFAIIYGPVALGHVIGQSIAPFVGDRDDAESRFDEVDPVGIEGDVRPIAPEPLPSDDSREAPSRDLPEDGPGESDPFDRWQWPEPGAAGGVGDEARQSHIAGSPLT